MTVRDLDRFEVLSFDCYGTLIDWENGIWTALQPLVAGSGIEQHEALSAFALVEADHEARCPGTPYTEILRMVHRELANRLELQTDDTADLAFAGSVGEWPAFADSHEALTALESRYHLVILSNVDRSSFAGSQRRLGIQFDAVYTAEDIGSYKPDPANFEYLIARVGDDLGVDASGILHTAQSLFHDHVPACAAGLATAWIDRQRLSEGGDWGATAVVDDPPRPDYTFFTLAEMAEVAGLL